MKEKHIQFLLITLYFLKYILCNQVQLLPLINHLLLLLLLHHDHLLHGGHILLILPHGQCNVHAGLIVHAGHMDTQVFLGGEEGIVQNLS